MPVSAFESIQIRLHEYDTLRSELISRHAASGLSRCPRWLPGWRGRTFGKSLSMDEIAGTGNHRRSCLWSPVAAAVGLGSPKKRDRVTWDNGISHCCDVSVYQYR